MQFLGLFNYCSLRSKHKKYLQSQLIFYTPQLKDFHRKLKGIYTVWKCTQNIYHELFNQYKQFINESKRKFNDNYINKVYNKCKASWSMVGNVTNKSMVSCEKYFSLDDFISIVLIL